MSELAVIDQNNYAAMAQMMGMAHDTGTDKKSTIARLRVNKKPIMGETEVNGKKVKVEVVSAGSYALVGGDGKTLYADNVVLRPFVQRFMYQKYNSEENNYTKTVLADNLNIDLKDTSGKFNCGKPSGYVQDFNALDEGVKELIRQVRRVRVVFGTVSASGVTEEGDAQDVENIPCIWEVDSKEGFKNIGGIFSKLGSLKRLPIQHTMEVATSKRDLPTGSSYYVPTAKLDLENNVEISDGDQATFAEFMSYIEGFNQWVLGEWETHHVQEDAGDDASIVDGFVHVNVEEDE